MCASPRCQGNRNDNRDILVKTSKKKFVYLSIVLSSKKINLYEVWNSYMQPNPSWKISASKIEGLKTGIILRRL